MQLGVVNTVNSRLSGRIQPGDEQLFAGRIKQLQALLDVINTQGQHAIVYGERGVGKTSLVSVCQKIATSQKLSAIRENCHPGDTFSTLWMRAIENIKINVEKRSIGFTSEPTRTLVTLANQLPHAPAPHDVVGLLRRLDVAIIFNFDEFDQVSDPKVAQAFADTIKALSDHRVPTKVVLVGVGDNIDQLIASHASIERALVQIRMPRMRPEELGEIISKGSQQLGMTWDDAATKACRQPVPGVAALRPPAWTLRNEGRAHRARAERHDGEHTLRHARGGRLGLSIAHGRVPRSHF